MKRQRFSANKNESKQSNKNTNKKMDREAFEGGSNDIQSIYTLNGKYSEESLDDVMLKFTDGFIDKIRSSKENSKTRDTMINDLTNIFNTLENDDGELIQIER